MKESSKLAPLVRISSHHRWLWPLPQCPWVIRRRVRQGHDAWPWRIHHVLRRLLPGIRMSQLQGSFRENEFDGFGTLVQEGLRFEGWWRRGQRVGHGKLSSTNGPGIEYEGSWYADLFDGHGSLKLPNGTVYVGDFRSHQVVALNTRSTTALANSPSPMDAPTRGPSLMARKMATESTRPLR